MIKGKSRSLLYHNNYVPGPGKYTPNAEPIRRRIAHKYAQSFIFQSISFGGKIEAAIPNADIPGPGQYEIKGIMTEAVISVKMGNSARNEGLKQFLTSGPGPAGYSVIKEFFKNRGPKYTYLLIRYCYRFGKGDKGKTFTPNSVPGPGTYPPRNMVGQEGPKPSLKPKRPDTSPKYGKYSPGPCAYDAGSYKPKTAAFSMGKSDRSYERIPIAKTPSAYNYDPKDDLLRPASPTWK